MADSKITDLESGTPKSTDLFVAVDTTDGSMAPTGTDKKYTGSAVAAFAASSITLSGDVTGSVSATVISDNSVTNSKLANMAAHTIKGNNTASSGDPIDLTIAQVKTDLNFGTMADQNANAVGITGGTIDDVDITNSSVSATSLAIPSFIASGIVHNNLSGVFSSSLIVNADVASGAAIVDTKLATISTVGKVSNSATTAVSTNTPSTIILRDGSGNFSAGTITASLSGNATTATTSTNFSGSLSGNVTGTQSSTVIGSGVIVDSMVNALAAIADTKLATISTSGKVSNSATTAASTNTISTIVLRDGSGNFAAGTITANLIGNATTSTTSTTSTNFTGSLSGNITGTQSATVIAAGVITDAMINSGAGIVDTKLGTISTSGKVSNSATTAVSTNTLSTIVLRDSSGNFAAGTITATLIGTATNFSGSLAGDVTGTQGATVIANSAVTNAKMANMAANTFKANNTAGSAAPTDITVAQAKTMLGVVGSVTISNTQIGFGNSSSDLIGSANLTWNDSTKVMNLASGSEINIGASQSSRKIVLYNTAANNFQFYGFGVGSGTLEYRVDQSASDHVFYSAINTVSQLEIMRANGTGVVQIGAGTPGTKTLFQVFSTTKASICMPKMTTTQRNAISSPDEGGCVYDVTLHQFMGWNGSSWVVLG